MSAVDAERKRISRRRLLAGGAIAGASLPLLHELVPHRGLHEALEGSGHDVAEASSGAAHAGHGAPGAPLHAAFRDGPEVDHAPTASTRPRSCATSTTATTRRLPGGRTLREYTIIARDKEIEVAPGVFYPAWTYNGRVPGPTLRCTEGDRLRIRFVNGSSHPHTMHFHGIHSAFMDGMPGIGEAARRRQIEPGESFDLRVRRRALRPPPLPLPRQPAGRPHRQGALRRLHHRSARSRDRRADELVMVMNAFDTNFDFANEVYAVNTVGFHYQRNPIQVKRDELVRIYLVNMLEYDLINSFHVHANFFHYYPTGTSLEPSELTDTIIQGQGQRGILEMRFPYPGRYMFHAHVTEFAELGWTGFFEVS